MNISPIDTLETAEPGRVSLPDLSHHHFAVDDDSGQLTNTGWVSSGGEIPRGMNLDPSGRFLYVGNQNSDTINVFRVQPESGQLEGPVQTVDSPVPMDFSFTG